MSEKPKELKILIDDIELEPILDFDNYTNTISGIIMGSDPKLSIGIYGEWGAGKTTLMQHIKDKLDSLNISGKPVLTVWFNAWRYEREDQFALIALLKSIAYAMDENDIYKAEVKEALLKSGWRILKGLRRKIEELEKEIKNTNDSE